MVSFLVPLFDEMLLQVFLYSGIKIQVHLGFCITNTREHLLLFIFVH